MAGEATAAHRLVKFGGFEFDFACGELRRNGRTVPLQTQPSQILARLLSRPGELVTREDLRRGIWADDTFVEFDTALNVAISKVRQALGDSAAAPRFIETLPKRGYRFLSDVREIAQTEPEAVLPPAVNLPVPSVPWRRWGVAGACLVVLLMVPLWNSLQYAPPAGPHRSVAVLPFRPLVTGTGDEALEIGLTEAVIVRLGRLDGLRVPSINTVQRYAHLERDARQVGRDLGVEAVLEGNLRRVNGKVRLSARLIDVATGTTMWGQHWDFPWTDILSVQDAMASEVARTLALSLATERNGSPQQHPTNAAAYEAYLRARYLLLRRTVRDSSRAAELLEEAVRRDPDSAAAHASLAFAYVSVPLLEGPTKPFVDLARRAAERALELDSTIAEAHAVLARILLHFDWDAEASDRASRRALALDPNDPFVLHCYALMLADEGRFTEALALADRALAQDPASVLANRDKAIILYLARRFEPCVEQCRRTVELDPYLGSVYTFLGRAYGHLGRSEQAVEAYLTPLTFSEENREMVDALRTAARRGGLKAFWKQRLPYLLAQPHVPLATVAAAYVQIGDHDNAMVWLERLYRERGAWIRGLKVQPVWDPLRGDARFQDLLWRARLTN
jgi:TolB-like protein/DNA-binding winged helix-turn-helix (wHTH) protein/cytochrome c-type biogenesis protein CcmH/NrfG